MSERLFCRLAEWLAEGPVVLASVLDTRGATPRKRGARMLIGAGDSAGSVGGGMAEARVIEAAHRLLSQPSDATLAAPLAIELDGRPGSAGVCGGRMHIALRRWHGATDLERAVAIASALASGQKVALSAPDIGADVSETGAPAIIGTSIIEPDPRLLIIGAGHCGHALYELARYLDFDLWVFDPRREAFADSRYAGATVVNGEHALLAEALDTQRQVLAILLNRDFHSDVHTLQALAHKPPAFIGMMGSRRRIHEVLGASPEAAAALAGLRAPVGLQIGAQTPHEIAVSILAQLVQWQHHGDPSRAA
jgi:xanthine dehydrogenase accessory factor